MIIEVLSPRPAILGVLDGQLVDCPNCPNCVSSQANDYGHKADPIRYTTSTLEAKAKLMGWVCWRQCRVWPLLLSSILKSKTNSFICVPPLAYIGHSDLGVNRKRVEEIRKRFGAAN